MNLLSTLVATLPVAIATVQSDPLILHGLPHPTERARELRLKLPFEEGAEFLCCQGVGGTTSHHHGFQNEFSWDFEMPVGTPVHASAHGRVVLVVEENSEGGFDEAMKSKANAIWIDHGGGSLSSYVHLAHNSSLVQVGQLVRAGQPIAKSGNTGYSVGPHLHFAVINCLGESLKASFVDVGVPVEGSTYISKNDGADCTWWTADSKIPSELFASAGISLSAAPRAHFWDPAASVRFAGQCPGEDEIVFFASDWGGGETLFHKRVPADEDGYFEFKLEPSELTDLSALTRFRVSLAPIDEEGNFTSANMLGVHWMEPAPAAARAVHLPFVGDEPRKIFGDEVIPVGKGKAQRELHSVTIELGDGQEARACAGGRVLQIMTTSKSGIRSSVSPRSACVRVDHGGGLEVLYAGLDPRSVNCVAGDVVVGGSVLGTVGVQAMTSSCKLLLAVDGAKQGPLELIEASGAANRPARLSSKNEAANELIFARDSRLAPSAFSGNGVTLEPGNSTPASTYHVGTRYLIRGSTTEASGTVEFVVRSVGAKKAQVLAETVALESGEFELEVVLPNSLKNKCDRYALTSYRNAAKSRGTRAVWRLLLAMR